MGNASTVDVLTRFAIAANGLGIDLTAFQAEAPRLGTSPGDGARIAIDSDGQRISLRCSANGVTGLSDLGRPGTPEYEIETSPVEPRIAHRMIATQTLALDDDLRLLAAAGVTAPACEQLASIVGRLGKSQIDVVSLRDQGDQIKWSLGIMIASGDVMTTLAALLAIAEELGVEAFQRRMLEQAQLALGRTTGVLVTLASNAAAMLPQLGIEYRNVAWAKAVGLTDAVRPGSPCGTRYGVLAGAYEAEAAAAIELTFRPKAPAWIRVAVTADALARILGPMHRPDSN